MEKSYVVLCTTDLVSTLSNHNISKYIILNDTLAVVYIDESMETDIVANIEEFSSCWVLEEEMSSLINITDKLELGESATSASQFKKVAKNPYHTASGKNILIAIIDSGINYLHPDFINKNNTSKIVSIWDQNSNKKNPPTGAVFGSEFTRDDINEAIINNDDTLTNDETGTGTIAAGICSGLGNLNSKYSGVAVDSELVVVKLKEHKNRYKEGKINYLDTDFLCAIKYVLDVAKKEKKSMIINLTIGSKSASGIIATYLDTFTELSTSNIIVVSGAGNEGNTDIHYNGTFKSENYEDAKIQVGDQKNLNITVSSIGPDKTGVTIISPSGELSYRLTYAPDNFIYRGRFNLEETTYDMRIIYPYIFSGNQLIQINLYDIKPGIWTLRLYPEFTVTNEFDIYLPNNNLISNETRFIDPNSFNTITTYAIGENIITVGTYDNRTDSIWIGSSKGTLKEIEIKPDIVAPGVNIISTFKNNSYNTSTGSGVSSSLACGALAMIMEYVTLQGKFEKSRLYTRVLRTFLMLGADKKSIYVYPNESEGYGNLNLENTITAIARIL